jgi:hypothetical protein
MVKTSWAVVILYHFASPQFTHRSSTVESAQAVGDSGIFQNSCAGCRHFLTAAYLSAIARGNRRGGVSFLLILHHSTSSREWPPGVYFIEGTGNNWVKSGVSMVMLGLDKLGVIGCIFRHGKY